MHFKSNKLHYIDVHMYIYIVRLYAVDGRNLIEGNEESGSAENTTSFVYAERKEIRICAR